MSNPDQIRSDIERTRAELGYDVDALADKVTPSKIVERQTDKVKDTIGGIKDKVMGVASDAKENVMGVASDAKDNVASAGGTIANAPQKAVQQAKGNPLAVGLVAFGLGWLVASLIPASEKEKEIASNVKDAAQPLVEKAQDAVMEVAENLKEPAQQAATAVKDTATDAVDSVKAETSSAADDVKSKAAEAKTVVQDQASPY